MTSLIFAVALLLVPGAHAGPETGNGTGLGQLEGFEDYAVVSNKLQKAIAASTQLIKNFGLETNINFPELRLWAQEVQFSRYILVRKDVTVSPNRSPGDYPIGTFLVASTELQRGAPTKIYPRLIGDLSDSQLVQMVLHEALHRALPEPMNGSESACEKITNIVTQYAPQTVIENLSRYFEIIRNKRIPWKVFISQTNWRHDGWRDSERVQIIHDVLKPLFSESIIAETTHIETVRLAIFFAINKESGDIEVSVTDRYRDFVFRFRIEPKIKGHSEQLTRFIRNSIIKVEEELRM